MSAAERDAGDQQHEDNTTPDSDQVHCKILS
jgi:hypothetical protein